MEELRATGQSNLIPWLNALYVGLKYNKDGSVDVIDAYLALAEKFQKLSPAQALYYGSNLGMDQGTINLLIKGRDVVQQILEQQRKIGVENDANAKQSQDLLNSWTKLEQTITQIGHQELFKWAPALVRGLDTIRNALNWLNTHSVADWLKSHTVNDVARDAAPAVGDWLFDSYMT